MTDSTQLTKDQRVAPPRIDASERIGSRARTHASAIAIPLVTVIVMLAAWEAWAVLADVNPLTLPSPTSIASKMFDDYSLFLDQSWPTLSATLQGFGLAIVGSIGIAIVMVYWTWLRKIVYPLAVISQVVPKVALAPLLLIWMGYGQLPKVLLVLLISFFPVLVDSTVGFEATSQRRVLLLRSMGATRWQEFWKLRLPTALPHIFGGLKVGVALALTGEIVAEFVGSDKGLGYLLQLAQGNLNTQLAFAVIGYLVIMGAVLYLIIEAAEAMALRSRRG